MEQIILFLVAQREEEQIRRLASVKKISVTNRDSSHAAGTLAELCAGKDNGPLPALEKIPDSSLMLFCDVTEKHFDKLLFEMRMKNVSVDYKAVLTPSNRQWTIPQLLRELERERSQIMKGN